jgi:SpoVK/Ycf46/Vps4 family AAA+-type ATPase
MVRVTHRDRVVGEWGGRLHGGPVALFSGPSGTGKTFAAEAVARELGWPLYRVDLGLLVSKYVGETEKNLSSLFDAADGRRMVLLFDEADALFGKRGEVREARDRYANMEVSHLLSRMERHEGPCILTSNLRRSLDPAFARRFQSVIEFAFPDARDRERLWRLYLPPKAPYEPDVHPARLAAALELSGAQIANVSLQAAFLAASEGRPLGLEHVARAARTEFLKSGAEFLPSSLGELSAFLPPEPGATSC